MLMLRQDHDERRLMSWQRKRMRKRKGKGKQEGVQRCQQEHVYHAESGKRRMCWTHPGNWIVKQKILSERYRHHHHLHAAAVLKQNTSRHCQNDYEEQQMQTLTTMKRKKEMTMKRQQCNTVWCLCALAWREDSHLQEAACLHANYHRSNLIKGRYMNGQRRKWKERKKKKKKHVPRQLEISTWNKTKERASVKRAGDQNRASWMMIIEHKEETTDLQWQLSWLSSCDAEAIQILHHRDCCQQHESQLNWWQDCSVRRADESACQDERNLIHQFDLKRRRS